MNRRVRVNSKYVYVPVLMDRINPPFGDVKHGEIVKVINKFGCPPANTMGMCYIEKDGIFMGMVCTNSLWPIKEYKKEIKNEIASK